MHNCSVSSCIQNITVNVVRVVNDFGDSSLLLKSKVVCMRVCTVFHCYIVCVGCDVTTCFLNEYMMI